MLQIPTGVRPHQGIATREQDNQASCDRSVAHCKTEWGYDVKFTYLYQNHHGRTALEGVVLSMMTASLNPWFCSSGAGKTLDLLASIFTLRSAVKTDPWEHIRWLNCAINCFTRSVQVLSSNKIPQNPGWNRYFIEKTQYFFLHKI